MNEYIRKKIIAEKSIASIIKRNSQTTKSGIYIYERTDERGIRYFYVGQAVNIFERQIGHWNGWKQRIDVSLKKRKFKNENNPYGWTFRILEYCDKDKLDERESFYIEANMQEGKQTYNRTFGSQGEGKVSMDMERKPAKGYYDGKRQGNADCRKKVKEYFDKYLDPVIKGMPNKIKERKLEEFKNFIGESND